MAEMNGPALAAAMAVLAAERDAYVRVLEMARRQRELAAAGKSEELLAVLAERQRLADEVAAAAERTREIKAAWNESAPKLAEPERARGAGLIAVIRDLLGKIIAEDDECRKLLGGQREGALEEMLRLQKGRRVNQAYGRKPPAPPRFKDEKK